MIVTTGNDVEGAKVVQYLGVVRGIVVRATSIGAGFIGGLKSLAGGKRGRKLSGEWCSTRRKWAPTPLSECATTRPNLRKARPKFSHTERRSN
jgi:hypothetical protein